MSFEAAVNHLWGPTPILVALEWLSLTTGPNQIVVALVRLSLTAYTIVSFVCSDTGRIGWHVAQGGGGNEV